VVADPCGSGELLDPPIGPTVDDLVSAIANLAGFGTTTPLDIKVDGFDGKQFTVTAPDVPDCGLTWAAGERINGMGPGEANVVRILDVNGVRVVITGAYDPVKASEADRTTIEQCVLCHNPNLDDSAFRAAEDSPPEGVNFKDMIHKIHTGEELVGDFTVYGFGNTPHNYNEVAFPGDRRNCAACHVNNSEQLPLKEGVLPSQAPRDLIHPKEPITAACLSCHTSRAVASHALLNTSRLGEACEVCHGPNADFSVTRAHAR